MIPNVVCSNKPESDVDFIKALEEYIQYFNHKRIRKERVRSNAELFQNMVNNLLSNFWNTVCFGIYDSDIINIRIFLLLSVSEQGRIFAVLSGQGLFRHLIHSMYTCGLLPIFPGML